MTIRTAARLKVYCRHAIVIVAALASLSLSGGDAMAQRVLGLDISAWQGSISQTTWNNIKSVENRQFVILRSSRGGTTGYYDQNDSANNNSLNTFSQRYDDPYFIQNVNRATTAGMFVGMYHFTRPDIIATTKNSGGIANTGADEAAHFMQMAGPWMRPGYLVPTHDFEAGDGIRTDDEMAQFCIDFSNAIYNSMGIRPAIYTNGNYAANILGTASTSLRNQIAQPSSTQPSVVSPDYPTLWSARWPNQTDPNSIDVQNTQPKDTYSPIYGPWDDYGVTHPWQFWQYASTAHLPSYSTTANLDVDVSHGDIEYLKDQLIPAVWMNDNSGDWSETWGDGTAGKNWNSGLPVVAPVTGAGQVTPAATGPLPTKRLPGATGSGPTSGQNDTVILERPNANITVTLSTGTHNIRKLYMRETLNITGGSLTINYDPNYISDTINYPNALRSGLVSAQFSGPVTLSGSGSLSMNTLQVDANKTFTLAGSTGTLTFKQINLLSSSKIAVTGDVNINPLSNATATISGSSGNVDLGGGTRVFNLGNGTSSVDLDVAVPIINGGLTKNGAGTMRLSGANTFTGAVTVNAGVLVSNNAAGFSSSSVVTVNGGTLDMNGITDTVASLAGTSGGIITQGSAGLTIAATSGTSTFAGTITGTGTFTKNGGATQVLNGNNSLGSVALNGGSLLFNGTNTTGAITVASGATLGGTGSVTGAVTVNSGGHFAPGASIESLGVGALTLNPGLVLDIELAAPGTSDLINVSGLLTLGGGSVNLINLGGIDAGTYTLINYGTRTGSVSNLGTPTGGPSNFNYNLVDTGSAINLSVTIPGDFNLDGTVNGSDYVVWRKGVGTIYTPVDYDLWRTNYGRTAGSGSGASLGDVASVPEPATAFLVIYGLLPFIIGRIQRRA